MSISTAELRALVSAGATAATIVAAIEVGEEKSRKRREQTAARVRKFRSLMPPEREWLPLVGHVLARDKYQCTYCGSPNNLTADHVIPLSRGGNNDISNLVACCSKCNASKSNRLFDEWMSTKTGRAGLVSVYLSASNGVQRVTCGVQRVTEGQKPQSDVPTPIPTAQFVESPACAKNDETELKKGLPHTPSKETTNPAGGKRSRGTHLADDWKISEAEMAYARERGLDDDRIRFESERFRNWATSASGQNSLKRNWTRAWQNWVLRITGPPKRANLDRQTAFNFVSNVVEIEYGRPKQKTCHEVAREIADKCRRERSG